MLNAYDLFCVADLKRITVAQLISLGSFRFKEDIGTVHYGGDRSDHTVFIGRVDVRNVRAVQIGRGVPEFPDTVCQCTAVVGEIILYRILYRIFCRTLIFTRIVILTAIIIEIFQAEEIICSVWQALVVIGRIHLNKGYPGGLYVLEVAYAVFVDFVARYEAAIVVNVSSCSFRGCNVDGELALRQCHALVYRKSCRCLSFLKPVGVQREILELYFAV